MNFSGEMMKVKVKKNIEKSCRSLFFSFVGKVQRWVALKGLNEKCFEERRRLLTYDIYVDVSKVNGGLWRVWGGISFHYKNLC